MDMEYAASFRRRKGQFKFGEDSATFMPADPDFDDFSVKYADIKRVNPPNIFRIIMTVILFPFLVLLMLATIKNRSSSTIYFGSSDTVKIVTKDDQIYTLTRVRYKKRLVSDLRAKITK